VVAGLRPAGTGRSPVTTQYETTQPATTTRRVPARTLTRLLLPQTTVDRFTLCQLVAADVMVLVVMCRALSPFSPAWGPPWASLPIFAVLATLFGFSAGLYQRARCPSPAGIV